MTAPLIKVAGKALKQVAKHTRDKKASELTFSEAAAEINRLNANINKRVNRISKMGIQTEAIEQFLVNRMEGKPETRNAAVSMVAKLRKLDLNPGTRVATAAKTKAREFVSARRAELRRKSKDPNQLIKMGRDELIETARILRSDTRDRIRRVRKAAGTTYGVEQAEDTIEEMDLESGSRNSILAAVSNLNRITNFKSLTPSGAKEINAWTTDIFGTAYDSYTKDQKSALWDEMHRIMEKESLTSGTALEIVRTTLKKDSKVVFHSEVQPDGTSKVVANIGGSLSEAEALASRREAQNTLIDKYFNESIRKRKERAPWTKEMGEEFSRKMRERRRGFRRG